MLYFRAVYDLASIVKLVADKVTPADRIQILTLLNEIQKYLQSADVLSSSYVTYDEPLVVIRNLVISIEETNFAKFNDNILCSKKDLSSAENPASSSAVQSWKPRIAHRMAIKRPPAPPESDFEDDDHYEQDGEIEGQIVEIDEEVHEETEWQPIDALEQALTAIAQEQNKTNYVVDVEREGYNRSYSITKSKASAKSPKIKSKFQPKRYLPIGEEYVNPSPRTRMGGGGVTKWPANGRWVCKYCRQIFYNVKNYKDHLRKVHKQEGWCCCRFCKKEMPNTELLKMHECPSKNKCNICKKQFYKPSKLRAHMRTHIKSTIVGIKCRICGEHSQHFGSVYDCARHVYDEHEMLILCDCCLTEMDPSETAAQNPVRMYCRLCGEEAGDDEPTKLPSNPNTDISIVSEKIEIYKRSRPSQPKPLSYNTSKVKEDIVCAVCNFSTTETGQYNKHIKTLGHLKKLCALNGEPLPQFPCDVCDKIFLTEDNKDSHYKRNHGEGAVLLKCKLCDKEFVTAQGLRTHLSSHMNLRDIKCDDCGQAFNSRSDMRNHREWKHTVGFPQVCKHCDERFKHRKTLREHIRRVHDRLVYRCPACDVEATKAWHLKKHISQKHDLKWTTPGDYLTKTDRPYIKQKKVTEQFSDGGDSENSDTADAPSSPTESTSCVIATRLRMSVENS